MKALLVDRWRALEAGQQRTLAWVAGITLLLVVYAFVWRPMSVAQQRYQRQIPLQREQLAEMQKALLQVREYRRAGEGKAPATEIPLRALVANGTLKQGLPAAATVRFLSDREIEVTAAEVDARTLVDWLAGTRSSFRLTVATATIERLPRPGAVSFRGTLLQP